MKVTRASVCLALAVVVFWTGCSSVEPTRRPTTMAEATRIVGKTEGREVQVTIFTERGFEVHRGRMAPLEPERFFLLEPSGARSYVPFGQTTSISYTDHGRGALDGFLAGALPGFGLGFLIGLCAELRFDDDPNAHHDPSCPMNMPLGLVLGLVSGLFTGAVGTVVGAGAGHTTTLTF